MILNKRLFQYIFRFGLVSGLELFLKVRASFKQGVIEFKIPGLPHEVFLRRNSSDFLVFEEIFIDEIYKMDFKDNVNYIIDAGANIGLAALYFQKHYPGAKIFSVEPVFENYKLLIKNTSPYPSIKCYHNGLWNKKCNLKITNLDEGDWAFMVEETFEEKNDVIHAISVNTILTENSIKKIDILKIDIEGSEKEVFESENNWISKTKKIIVEVHENKRIGATKSVLSALKDFSYKKLKDTFYLENNNSL